MLGVVSQVRTQLGHEDGQATRSDMGIGPEALLDGGLGDGPWPRSQQELEQLPGLRGEVNLPPVAVELARVRVEHERTETHAHRRISGPGRF